MKAEQWDTRNTPGKHSFRFWFYIGLAATLLVWTSAADAEDVTVTDTDGSPWTISINPGPVRRALSTATRVVPPLPEAAAGQELASAGPVSLPIPAPVLAGAAQDTGVVILPNPNAAVVNGRSYAEVYRSIPYSKTEYYANPSYRHDATMEILFGQLRPGSGGGHPAGRIIENPVYTPYRPYLFAHWDYFQTSTLLRPRLYRPLYGATYCYGY